MSNTLIKQGAKPVAMRVDVGENQASQVHLELEAEAGIESKLEIPASLQPDPVFSLTRLAASGSHRMRDSAQRRVAADFELLETQWTSTELFYVSV